MTFELNIPEANETDSETTWMDHPSEVGESVSILISRIHVGEKTVCIFDDVTDKAISFFHVSDYEGQTTGERALIALAQAAGVEGKTDSDAIVTAANAFFADNPASITETLRGYTHEGEARSFRAITVKVE